MAPPLGAQPEAASQAEKTLTVPLHLAGPLALALPAETPRTTRLEGPREEEEVTIREDDLIERLRPMRTTPRLPERLIRYHCQHFPTLPTSYDGFDKPPMRLERPRRIPTRPYAG